MCLPAQKGIKNEALPLKFWIYYRILKRRKKSKMQNALADAGRNIKAFLICCCGVIMVVWEPGTVSHRAPWNIMLLIYFGSTSNHQTNKKTMPLLILWQYWTVTARANVFSLAMGNWYVVIYQFEVHRNNSNLGLTVNKLHSRLLYSVTCFGKPEWWVNIARRQTSFGSGGCMHGDRQCVITGSVNACGLSWAIWCIMRLTNSLHP